MIFHNVFASFLLWKFITSIQYRIFIIQGTALTFVLAVPFLYSFSVKSRMVFICHVDLWTISNAKSSARKSTRAVLGRIYFPLICTAKMRFWRICESTVCGAYLKKRNFCLMTILDDQTNFAKKIDFWFFVWYTKIRAEIGWKRRESCFFRFYSYPIRKTKI